jgi:hypothetical protein
MIANLENMRRYCEPGVFAYSPNTGEECSADPYDYFTLGPDDFLTDELGEPMVLVRRHTEYIVITGGEE